MGLYPARSLERAMKFQEVILRAMSKQITPLCGGEKALGVCASRLGAVHRENENREPSPPGFLGGEGGQRPDEGGDAASDECAF